MQFLRDVRQGVLLQELSHLASLGAGDEDGFQAHLKSMVELAGSDHAALARDTFTPGHFTASAFVLSPDRRSLLLILHSKLKMWLQPGGHIEPTDRDLVEAARREVREETGLQGLTLESSMFDLDVHRIPEWGETPAHLHHDVRCVMTAPHLEVRAGDDVSDARWFDLRTVASKTSQLASGFGTDESVRRVAARLATIYPK